MNFSNFPHSQRIRNVINWVLFNYIVCRPVSSSFGDQIESIVSTSGTSWIHQMFREHENEMWLFSIRTVCPSRNVVLVLCFMAIQKNVINIKWQMIKGKIMRRLAWSGDRRQRCVCMAADDRKHYSIFIYCFVTRAFPFVPFRCTSAHIRWFRGLD